ncbi:MAG: hypothetical protein M3Q09_01590 [Gemmatimonadota bacterium]|nr:hypothetical protein [Gemmatimonadota bacterium]
MTSGLDVDAEITGPIPPCGFAATKIASHGVKRAAVKRIDHWNFCAEDANEEVTNNGSRCQPFLVIPYASRNAEPETKRSDAVFLVRMESGIAATIAVAVYSRWYGQSYVRPGPTSE